MKMVIYFLLREHGTSLLLCTLFALLGVAWGGVWAALPFVFLLFFFYEWNVASKSQKTWDFFESLPLSFSQKYIIRALIPFLISSALIFLLTWSHEKYETSLVDIILESLRISAIFLVSSVLASSLATFFLWNIVCYFVCVFMSSLHYFSFSFVLFSAFFCAYILSQKRISAVKFYILPFVASVLVLLFGATLRIPLYTRLLEYSFAPLQQEVASILIQEDAFVEGKQFFYVSQAFNDSFFVWDGSHFNDDLVLKIEHVILQGKDCSELCVKMASKMQKNPDEWNVERLSDYLNAETPSQQIYALLVLQGSSRPMYFHRIVQLVRSPNVRVSGLAVALLRKWGASALFDLPTTPAF